MGSRPDVNNAGISERKIGTVLSTPVSDRLTHGRRRKKRDRKEPAGVLRLDERCRPGRVQVIDGDVVKIGPARERFDQRRWRRRGAVDEQAHPADNARDRGVGVDGPSLPLGSRRHDYLRAAGVKVVSTRLPSRM